MPRAWDVSLVSQAHTLRPVCATNETNHVGVEWLVFQRACEANEIYGLDFKIQYNRDSVCTFALKPPSVELEHQLEISLPSRLPNYE